MLNNLAKKIAQYFGESSEYGTNLKGSEVRRKAKEFLSYHSLSDLLPYESYDDEPDDHQRIEKIAHTLKQLEDLQEHRQDIFESAHEIIEHNWNHFYGGGFEAVLWQELKDMLNELEF